MAEGKWHKKTRLARIKEYQNEGYDVETSHSNKKIQLSYGKSSRITNLSDADIVVLKNEKIVKIEEIQSTCSPKQVIGIIKATDLCDQCKIDGEIYPLKNVKLIIAYKKQKEKSKKPEQLQLIKNNLKKNGCLRDFDFKEIVLNDQTKKE